MELWSGVGLREDIIGETRANYKGANPVGFAPGVAVRLWLTSVHVISKSENITSELRHGVNLYKVPVGALIELSTSYKSPDLPYNKIMSPIIRELPIPGPPL